MNTIKEKEERTPSMFTDAFVTLLITSVIICIAASAFVYRLLWVERQAFAGWGFANCLSLVMVIIADIICIAMGFGPTAAYLVSGMCMLFCQGPVAITWFVSTVVWRRWCRRNPYRTPCGGYIERPY